MRADGRTLQISKLMERRGRRASRRAGGAGASASPGTTIDTRMSPDGATVTNLTAQENVQVDLPAEGDAPARRITSATLRAAGAPGQGLQNAVFEGGVDFTETPAGRRQDAGARPARTVDAAHRRHQAGSRRGRARRLSRQRRASSTASIDRRGAARPLQHRPAISSISRPRPATPAPARSSTTAQLTVQALNIHLSPSTQKLKADTDVRSIIKPQKPAAPAAAAGGPRRAAPAARRRRTCPAMLKQDKPVNVTSNRLDYDGVVGGHLQRQRAARGRTSRGSHAETIVMNDRTGNLTAQMKVRTTMMLEDEDPKTKVRKLTETDRDRRYAGLRRRQAAGDLHGDRHDAGDA